MNDQTGGFVGTRDVKDWGFQAQIFRALSHPVRMAILEILRPGEECVCHMEAALGLRQAYISQQLMVLRDAGLIQDRRDGWNIFYRVMKPQIYKVFDALNELGEEGALFIRKQPASRIRLEGCPCRKCNPSVRMRVASELDLPGTC